MKRILCVYLPHWPIQRLLRTQPAQRDKAVAILQGGGRQPTISDLTATAHREGVRPGMTRAEALATFPPLRLVPHEPAVDRQALTDLAIWAEWCSPIVGLEEAPFPTSLLLDVTGCAACCGGEEALFTKVGSTFRAAGWQVRLGLAATVGAAWAWAHGSRASVYQTVEAAAAALPTLPLELLRLTPATLGKVQSFGFHSLGCLMQLPRAGVAATLGTEVLHRLDQALGAIAEPVVGVRQLPPLVERLSFEPALTERQWFLRSVEELIDRVTVRLLPRCRGVLRLEYELELEAGGSSSACVGLCRPSQSVGQLQRLFRVHLEKVTLPGPLSGISLRVVQDAALTDAPEALFDAEHPAWERDRASLLEQLTARLGAQAVTAVRPRADPQPELACQFVPAMELAAMEQAAMELAAMATPVSGFTGTGSRFRPLRLWRQPRPLEVLAAAPSGFPHVLRLGSLERQVAQAWGPERIETGWWRGREIARDYFAVETREGARWWIFRRLDDERWFWHGCFE